MLEFKEILVIVESIVSDFAFKRVKNSFIRKSNDKIQIIEVQKYSFKSEANITITINIGLVIPNIFQKVFGKNSTPSVSEGIIYFNIGELINDFNGRIINKHWVLENEYILKSELTTLLNKKVIPFFNNITTSKDIIEFVQNNKIASKSTTAVKMQINELTLQLGTTNS